MFCSRPDETNAADKKKERSKGGSHNGTPYTSGGREGQLLVKKKEARPTCGKGTGSGHTNGGQRSFLTWSEPPWLDPSLSGNLVYHNEGGGGPSGAGIRKALKKLLAGDLGFVSSNSCQRNGRSGESWSICEKKKNWESWDQGENGEQEGKHSEDGPGFEKDEKGCGTGGGRVSQREKKITDWWPYRKRKKDGHPGERLRRGKGLTISVVGVPGKRVSKTWGGRVRKGKSEIYFQGPKAFVMERAQMVAETGPGGARYKKQKELPGRNQVQDQVPRARC